MSSIIKAMARKSLADMEPEELRKWLVERRTQLTNHHRFIQEYLDRRAGRGRKKTYSYSTDRQYARFQTLANDLRELLDAVIANVDQYQDAQHFIQELEIALERLRKEVAEQQRLLDIEICTCQAETQRLAEAARHGEVAASIRLDRQPAQA